MLRTQLRAIVAGWLIAALDQRGVGIEELADKAGIRRETVWKIRTEQSDANDATLAALARALNVPLPVLSVQDEKGAADYVAGVRATVKTLRAKLDEIETTPRPLDADPDGRAERALDRQGRKNGRRDKPERTG